MLPNQRIKLIVDGTSEYLATGGIGGLVVDAGGLIDMLAVAPEIDAREVRLGPLFR